MAYIFFKKGYVSTVSCVVSHFASQIVLIFLFFFFFLPSFATRSKKKKKIWFAVVNNVNWRQQLIILKRKTIVHSLYCRIFIASWNPCLRSLGFTCPPPKKMLKTKQTILKFRNVLLKRSQWFSKLLRRGFKTLWASYCPVYTGASAPINQTYEINYSSLPELWANLQPW